MDLRQAIPEMELADDVPKWPGFGDVQDGLNGMPDGVVREILKV